MSSRWVGCYLVCRGCKQIQSIIFISFLAVKAFEEWERFLLWTKYPRSPPQTRKSQALTVTVLGAGSSGRSFNGMKSGGWGLVQGISVLVGDKRGLFHSERPGIQRQVLTRPGHAGSCSWTSQFPALSEMYVYTHTLFFFFLAPCTLFFFFFCFFWAAPAVFWGAQAGVELELQLPAYTTTTATRDLSRVCNLHHSSHQRQILNPLREARGWTCILMDARQIRFHQAMKGNFQLTVFFSNCPSGPR